MPQTKIASPTQIQKQARQITESRQPMLLWHKIALGAVLAISTFLNFFSLNTQDYYEYYYAAAIKSMLTSWHAMFFAAFDPAGFLALDKPPLGFWMQALSVRLFGYSVFSILLPEALAGVLAVALLFYLVYRVFGPLAGLIAALVLALTPISVVTSRNNIVDGLLVLTVLLATWAVSKATETGRLWWLCLCAVLIGLGFNIKYLQAYIVIPAFGLTYWSGAPSNKKIKLFHSALALVILLAVSLCWITAVDLTPANQRPSIDSISSDSELDLAFGYNGAFRLTANDAIVNNWVWEIGRPGATRFFEQPVAGQCSWFIPLALFSLLSLTRRKGRHQQWNRQQQALVLWGTWLLIICIFFSNAHFFHLYYLSMVAPAIAALTGAGIVIFWQDYCRNGWRGWLLPCAFLMTGAVQFHFLAAYPLWRNILIGSIAICCTILVLIRWYYFQYPEIRRESAHQKASKIKRRQQTTTSSSQWSFPKNRAGAVTRHIQKISLSMTALGLLILLLAPTGWIMISLNPKSRVYPIAGPLALQTLIPPLIADPVLIHYLLAHKGRSQFLLATMNTEAASPFILETGQAVMALGGYSGNNNFLSSEQLIQHINQGQVRFFLLPNNSNQAGSWVITHCQTVPTYQWQSSSTARFSVDELTLYDCYHHS